MTPVESYSHEAVINLIALTSLDPPWDGDAVVQNNVKLMQRAKMTNNFYKYLAYNNHTTTKHSAMALKN